MTELGNKLVMPPIVYFEIERWLLEIGAKNKQKKFEKMCQDISLGDLNKQIWDIAAKLYVLLRKKGTPASDADLIIASFCIANDYTLVTNNTRHFENIKELKIVNWKE